jgi:pimeloyl-ACP methyl ester carboxylesterase
MLLVDRDPKIAAYQLSDLAADAVGLLDHLDIEQAHVVGASMGGMVAQLVAVDHPERVRSLCSIMSTTGAPFAGLPTLEAAVAVMSETPAERDRAIAHVANVMRIIGSKTHAQTEQPARLALAEASYVRAFYPEGTRRQFAAIVDARGASVHRGLRRPVRHSGPATDRSSSRAGSRRPAAVSSELDGSRGWNAADVRPAGVRRSRRGTAWS